jgi:2-polyprenyl-3-methyl-5-hydroxy-6-metoxy-1,4-benzoquinol methylase
MYLNYQSCFVCGNKKRSVISHRGRNFSKLTTVICEGCGLLHSHPIPTLQELEIFYQESYRIKYKNIYKPQKRHTFRYARGCIKIISELFQYLDYEFPNDKEFLDIGSGSGEVLYFAKKFGFNELGIEPNTGYANFSKNDLGLNVINSTLEKTDFGNKKFDVINSNQVLEHLPNPVETLGRLKNLLHLNGLLVLTVPDIEANLHSSSTLFHYAHIFNYNHLTLKKIFDKVGFQILNPYTKGTKIYAKKVLVSDNTIIDFNFKKNYEKISTIINNNNLKAHYFTKMPYIRFLKKCLIYPKEIIVSWLFKNHRSILDNTYRKFKNL